MCVDQGAIKFCKCAQGLCATAAGACEAQDGEWKGVYSVKFTNPSVRESAYLSAYPNWAGVYQAIRSADIEPMWKIALLENKHVRLESVQYPGYYLSLTNGGEAGFMVQLEKLEGVLAPAQVTFVVQETRNNGGGLQLWSPVHQVALIPGSLTSGSVTLCDAGSGGPFACTGKEFVQFTPELPNEVVSTSGTRVAVSIIPPLKGWQRVLVLAVLSVCCFGACFGPAWFFFKGTPESSEAAA
jgi:hypothetical protein